MAGTELVFYYAPHTRSGTVLWMFEELGVPYRMEVLNLKNGEHKTPAYLAINPMGKVPAITHGGVPVTEVAAICCYLADAFPQAGLAPAIGDPRRAPYLRWMFFSPSCIEPAISDKAFPRSNAQPTALGYGDFETVMNACSIALSNGDHVIGDAFSAADVVFGSTLRYGMMFGLIPKRPDFEAYVGRLTQRPTLQKAMARDEELAQSMTAS
ncbi:MAG: glutathione S-transferase family protein [Rhodomicrobium sp.]|nr:glutathione S-transferase family protein [Rhodomicrobium sp.]